MPGDPIPSAPTAEDLARLRECWEQMWAAPDDVAAFAAWRDRWEDELFPAFPFLLASGKAMMDAVGRFGAAAVVERLVDLTEADAFVDALADVPAERLDALARMAEQAEHLGLTDALADDVLKLLAHEDPDPYAGTEQAEPLPEEEGDAFLAALADDNEVATVTIDVPPGPDRLLRYLSANYPDLGPRTDVDGWAIEALEREDVSAGLESMRADKAEIALEKLRGLIGQLRTLLTEHD